MVDKPWTGRSEAHAAILDKIRRIAAREIEVLIWGPSGVGKEMYARAIHASSRRAARAFVAFNCGAIPGELIENELFGHVSGAFTGARTNAEGLVAEAEGGTLFLDEVDTLSLRNQVKLLRFLQEREYRRLGEPRVRRADVRIVAATNADLATEVGAGRFREDLLFRLRVAPIDVPSLCERKADIDVILEAYRDYYAREYDLPRIQLSVEAMAAIRAHDWPGNVRELENCVRYLTCLALSRAVDPADLPFRSAAPRSAGAAAIPTKFHEAKAALLSAFERTTVAEALDASRGNIAQAARLIGTPRRTFFSMMRKHGVTARRSS
jgi:two-component system, NtrC family, response regulator GlrR